jgi:MFS family permease
MVVVMFLFGALAFGVLASISVFLKPLSAEFGWSRGETSLGYTMISMSSAVFGILWGYVADRFGTRWFGLAAAVAMTVSLFALSQQATIYHFYALYFFFGAFGNAMLGSPMYANVGFWFKHRPGLALGITASGGAFGQGVVPYLAAMAIDAYDWQTAYQLLALGYLLMALPLALLIREPPLREAARLAPATAAKHDFILSEGEVVAWISVAVIFCCNCMAVPIVHLVPLLTDAGHSVEYATRILMLLMFFGVAGRVLGGRLCDLIGALPAYMFMSFGQTISVVWFPYVSDSWFLYPLAAFFGFTYSGVMSSILVSTRMMVSPGFGGRAMSVTSFFGWMGMGMGGFLGGYLFDAQGNYFTSFAFAGFLGVINLIILTCFLLRIRAARNISLKPARLDVSA